MKVYCPNCGEEYTGTDKNCHNCNYNLEEVLKYSNEQINSNKKDSSEMNSKITSTEIQKNRITIMIIIIIMCTMMFAFRSMIGMLIGITFLIIYSAKITGKRTDASKIVSALIPRLIPILIMYFCVIGLRLSLNAAINDYNKDYKQNTAPVITTTNKTNDSNIFNNVHNYTKPTISSEPVTGLFICINNDLQDSNLRKIELDIKKDYTFEKKLANGYTYEGAYTYKEITISNPNEKYKNYNIVLYPVNEEYNEYILTKFNTINNKREGNITYKNKLNEEIEYYCIEK